MSKRGLISLFLMVTLIFSMVFTMPDKVRAETQITLEDFSDISDWNGFTYNATISAAAGVGTVTCGNITTYGTVSKAVTLNLDSYPTLKINIPEVASCTQWALKVNDGGSDIELEHGIDSTGVFSFNLKAVTGWSGSKTFEIRLFPVGGNEKYLKIDYINASDTPMTTKTYANPTFSEYIGNVRMWGDPNLDCDTLGNSDSNQWRWLSYPLSRLVLNPNTYCTDLGVGAMKSNLSLEMGYYVGAYAVDPFRRTDIINVQVDVNNGTKASASSVNSTWYPHKIAYTAQYTGLSSSISGYDFFVNENSWIRALELSGPTGKAMNLSGIADGTLSWDAVNKVLLITASDYYYALRIVGLDSSMNAVELGITPSISGTSWTFRKSYLTEVGKVAVGYGFAIKSEGADAAKNRALACFDASVSSKMSSTKSYWDSKLRAVPAPTQWGITAVNAGTITPAQHKRSYYAAWTFQLSNIIAETPEKSYNFRQIGCGKPSLWGEGSNKSPNFSAWESLYQTQQISLVDPGTAWSSIEGYLSLTDQNGWIDGECLPSQKAHTAWIVYNMAPDSQRLAAVYPAIKRYLLWREAHPYWILNGEGNSSSRDVAFVTEFLNDVKYAIKICEELGYSSDIAMWQGKYDSMKANIGTWFTSPIKQYTYYYTDTGHYTADGMDNIGAYNYVLEPLLLQDLSASLDQTYMDTFMSVLDIQEELAGFGWLKYGDAVNIVYGLINRGYISEANQFMDACLKNIITIGEFSEEMQAGKYTVSGVNPSSFTSSAMIEFTLVKNGMRYDDGVPEAISTTQSSISAVFQSLEEFDSVDDWNAFTYNSSISTDGSVATITCGSGDSYGTVAKTVNYNVDDFPYLVIKTELGTGAKFAVKVNDGGTDIVLHGPNVNAGKIVYNLKNGTNWSGQKTFQIKLFSVGGSGKILKVDYIKAARIDRNTLPNSITLEDFSGISDWDRFQYNAAISTNGNVATITCGSVTTYGTKSKSVSYNVDLYPNLVISIPEVGSGAAWALKVNDGDTDIVLQADTNVSGTMTYNLKSITGWNGMKTFQIKLFPIGGNGKYVKADYINISH